MAKKLMADELLAAEKLRVIALTQAVKLHKRSKSHPTFVRSDVLTDAHAFERYLKGETENER